VVQTSSDDVRDGLHLGIHDRWDRLLALAWINVQIKKQTIVHRSITGAALTSYFGTYHL
jgi:hypothetical protein